MTLLEAAKANCEKIARELGHEGPFEWESDFPNYCFPGSYSLEVSSTGAWGICARCGECGEWTKIGGGKITKEELNATPNP